MNVDALGKVLAATAITLICGCAAQDTPGYALHVTGQDTGDRRDWARWGSGGAVAYALTTGPKAALLTYTWDGAQIRKHKEVTLPQSGLPLVAWLSQDKVLTDCQGSVVLRDGVTWKPLKEFPVAKGWWCWQFGQSDNGRYVAIALYESAAYPPPDFSWDRTRVRLGLYDVSEATLDWVGELSVKEPADGCVFVRRIAASPDASHIAVAGWCNGVAVVDVKKRKVLWERRPPGELASGYLAISPKKGVVYVGGSRGKVYAMTIECGDVVSAWWATDSGKERPGQRVTAICVSPDEKYVAAGTGPEGRTYVWSTKTGKVTKAFGWGPGGVLVAMFSPDSKHLAVFQAGRVEVAELPPDGG